MSFYTDNPIIIGRYRLGDEMPKWFKDKVNDRIVFVHKFPSTIPTYDNYDEMWCEVITPNGVLKAYEGQDYILKGITDDIYPCKIDIFDDIYKEDKLNETQWRYFYKSN